MRVLDFIICDDVRVEVNNKHTLVGVFGDSILFPVPKTSEDVWPKRIKLSFFVRLAVDESDTLPDEVSFSYILNEEEKEVARGKMTPPVSIKVILLVFSFDNIVIQNKGNLSFKLTFYKDGKITNKLVPDNKQLSVTSQVVD